MPAMLHDIARVPRHFFAGMARSYGICTPTLIAVASERSQYFFYAKLAHSVKR